MGRPLARAARTILLLALALALAAVAASGTVVPASPAGAHGGAGEITVVDVTETAPLQVELTAEIRYVLDGHPATPASFVVSGVGPDDAVLEPVALERTDDEGVYRAVLELPVAGSWSLTFQSSLPPAELDHELEVGGTTEAGGDGTTPPDTVGDGSSELVSSEGSGPPTLLLVGVVVSGLLVLAAGAVVIRTLLRQPRS